MRLHATFVGCLGAAFDRGEGRQFFFDFRERGGFGQTADGVENGLFVAHALKVFGRDLSRKLFLGDGDDAEDFVHRRVAGFDFFPAALAEGAHAVFASGIGEGAGGFAAEDELVHLVVEAEDFEEADAAAVTCAAAAVAADGGVEGVDEFGFGFGDAEDGEVFAELDLVDWRRARALGAEATDEALGDDELDGGSDEERFDAHVDETRDGAGGVVGVECREYQVTGERGADGDLGGVFVADFADHDDVGVLAEDVAECVGEGEADFGADLHLVHAGDFIFDRILDGDDAEVRGIDFAEEGVERGALAGAGGAGDEDDAVRVIEDVCDLRLFVGGHAEAIHRVGFLLLVEEAERNGFGVDGGDRRDADIEDGVAGAEVDASVLREAAFGDVETRHDLEARDDGVLET